MKAIFLTLALTFSLFLSLNGKNQTADVSPIYPAEDFPFDVKIEQMWFRLPFGLQSYVVGYHEGKWLILAGRLNGLHGFNSNPDNFPPDEQNRYAAVVDFENRTFIYRPLDDPESGLTQEQVDSLSVTAPQAYRSGKTLYMSGGYGFQTSTLQYITWPLLTAIDIPLMMDWVAFNSGKATAADCIRQVSHPLLRVTGGNMDKIGRNKKDPTLLMLGQDFEGTYSFGKHYQSYTEQIRKFHILDDGKTLEVNFIDPDRAEKTPYLRRRDLNIVRALHAKHGKITPSYLALSGVFTESGGAWTVPVIISKEGSFSMSVPSKPSTFKQGANNYYSSTMELYSKKKNEMYIVLFGGLTYEYFENGEPAFSNELPFTNQVTAIKVDSSQKFSQYLLNGAFPFIPSMGTNPGNPLLFGTSSVFFPREGVKQYVEYVLNYDSLKEPTVVGYILGGIQSTLPNTNTIFDSAASPYIFRVTLLPKESSESSSFKCPCQKG